MVCGGKCPPLREPPRTKTCLGCGCRCAVCVVVRVCSQCLYGDVFVLGIHNWTIDREGDRGRVWLGRPFRETAKAVGGIQWDLSNQDTNGAEEVSLLVRRQRLKCMQEWYLGWEKVSCLVRCPQFRG